ncbi:uncharacterized protein G2W53_013477 [Senna tora]|uniref:RNase H type-1 domain-containing protein n=1 Tax=Senna tora TaxID=362788 RepID=A0A834TZT5_9FABA|nr:uncharacterized protein G2W53_013477 [Senna tora]
MAPDFLVLVRSLRRDPFFLLKSGCLFGSQAGVEVHKKVILETDSILVKNFITKGCNKSSPLFKLLQDFNELLSRGWQVLVRVINRCCNSVVDKLAKSA